MTTIDQISDKLDKARQWSVLVDALFDEMLTETNALKNVHVQKRSRVKNRSSLVKKIEDKKKHKEYGLADVTDIVGFRFVCHFQNEVEQVVDVLLNKIKGDGAVSGGFSELREARIYVSPAPNQKALKEKLDLVFQKYAADVKVEEKASRYTSVHMVVQRAKDQIFEIQVRNVFEDAWAEIEHALKYKAGESDLSPSVDRHLQILNTFAQACSEYSESILLDSCGEVPTVIPQVSELFDDDEELKKLPLKARTIFHQASELRKKNLVKEAVALLSDFISQNPSLLNNRLVKYYVVMERGICYLKLGKAVQAISDYEALLEENPDRALIYFRLGDANRIAKDFKAAAEYFELIPKKLASTVNTTQEVEFLRKWPFTLAHTYWRLKQPSKSLEVLKDAHSSGLIPWEGGKLSFVNCHAYYLIEVSKQNQTVIAMQDLESIYDEFKSMNVTNGAYWAELDTFAVICELLGKDSEAFDCVCMLESMLKYENEGEPPTIILKDGTLEAPIEETEIVRAHIDRIKRKWAKK